MDAELDPSSRASVKARLGRKGAAMSAVSSKDDRRVTAKSRLGLTTKLVEESDGQWILILVSCPTNCIII